MIEKIKCPIACTLVVFLPASLSLHLILTTSKIHMCMHLPVSQRQTFPWRSSDTKCWNWEQININLHCKYIRTLLMFLFLLFWECKTKCKYENTGPSIGNHALAICILRVGPQYLHYRRIFIVYLRILCLLSR
jgi:hypothetical protein